MGSAIPMLCLSRRAPEAIVIADCIRVVILGVQGAQVRLGIEAPPNIPVHREEVYQSLKDEGRRFIGPRLKPA